MSLTATEQRGSASFSLSPRHDRGQKARISATISGLLAAFSSHITAKTASAVQNCTFVAHSLLLLSANEENSAGTPRMSRA
jgi:hypothetical protein